MHGIIIEGCDGTGKTTLAKKLSNKYNLDICHCTSEDPADYEFYKNTLRKRNVVWDRHFLGELIYPEVFNRRAQIGIEDARLLVAYARESGVQLLVLTESINELQRRLNYRGNECDEVLKQLEYINNKFKEYAESFDIPIICSSQVPFVDICDIIEKDAINKFEFIHK